MNATSRMVALLGELKREMNGAVVDSMREKGLDYPLNYGVSLPTIRSLAREFAPDDELAQLLYRQQVRELQLAATVIADPRQLSESDLAFWHNGITTVEIAENLAMSLVSRSPVAGTAIRKWIADPSPLVRYAAIMTAVRIDRPALEELLPELEKAVGSTPENLIAPTAHGIAALLAARGQASETDRKLAREFIASLPASRMRERIDDEAGWQLAD